MSTNIGTKIPLETIVKEKIGTEGTIYIVGLAGDICVLDTAINGARIFPNNQVRIIYEFIRPAFVLEAHGGFGYVNTPDNYCYKLKLSENLKMISIQGLPTLYTWNKYKKIITLGAVAALGAAAYRYWRSTGFGKKTKRTSKKRKSRRRKSSVRRKRSVKK